MSLLILILLTYEQILYVKYILTSTFFLLTRSHLLSLPCKGCDGHDLGFILFIYLFGGKKFGT